MKVYEGVTYLVPDAPAVGKISRLFLYVAAAITIAWALKNSR